MQMMLKARFGANVRKVRIGWKAGFWHKGPKTFRCRYGGLYT